MTTNEEIDAYILESLPSTFAELWGRKQRDGFDCYRQIDRRLQSLRKRGLIGFVREGRRIIWNRKPAS